jgi:hypothetical protein
MLHLVISSSSYLLFFAAKALMPTQRATWRTEETRSGQCMRDSR